MYFVYNRASCSVRHRHKAPAIRDAAGRFGRAVSPSHPQAHNRKWRQARLGVCVRHTLVSCCALHRPGPGSFRPPQHRNKPTQLNTVHSRYCTRPRRAGPRKEGSLLVSPRRAAKVHGPHSMKDFCTRATVIPSCHRYCVVRRQRVLHRISSLAATTCMSCAGTTERGRR